MELADLRDRFPALDGLLVQITGLLTRRRVVLAASDRVLSLAWWEQGEQRIITTDLPPAWPAGGIGGSPQRWEKFVAESPQPSGAGDRDRTARHHARFVGE